MTNGEIKIEATVRTLKDSTTTKKDVRKMQGSIVLMNLDGDRVDIKSDPTILDGFNAEDEVIITVKRNQKTLAESLPPNKK